MRRRRAETPELEIERPRISRAEWMSLGLVLLIGAALRLAFPSHVAVEHFDEGVYASNIFFPPEQGAEYPARHLYAPRTLPWLLESWQIAIGLPPAIHGGWPILVGFSLLSILAAWGIGRTVSQEVGLAVAILMALGDTQLVYSRAMLTDLPMVCAFLASVFFWHRTVERDSYSCALMTGLSAGFAWSLKYNGWLPLAVIVAATAVWMALRSRQKAPPSMISPAKLAGHLAIASGAAVLCFWGVLSDLAAYGGYEVVSQNHSRFFVGISGWWDSLIRQIANLRELESPLSWAALFAATAVVVRRSLADVLLTSLAIAAAGLLITMAGVLFALGGGWTIYRLVRAWKGESVPLVEWMISAWFWGLFLAAPLYTPYPRLMLPWIVAASLASAQALQAAGPRIPRRFDRKLVAAFASVFAIAGGVLNGKLHVPAWEDRGRLIDPADQILRLAEALARNDKPRPTIRTRFVIYVHGEPGLFFQIRRHYSGTTAPASRLNLKAHEVPTLIVIGPHTLRERAADPEWRKNRDRYELLATIPYRPSTLVRLNTPEPNHEEKIEVYRLR